MINTSNTILIRNKSKIFKFIKKIFNRSSYFILIISLLLGIISTKAYITKIGYELAKNNKIYNKLNLKNKLLKTEISKLKSNSRLKDIATRNNMKFPKNKNIKSVIYE